MYTIVFLILYSRQLVSSCILPALQNKILFLFQNYFKQITFSILLNKSIGVVKIHYALFLLVHKVRRRGEMNLIFINKKGI